MSNYIRTDGKDNVIELQLSVLIVQEGNYFVAFCPTLEISSYGETVEEAREGFEDVMNVYLEETSSQGKLKEDLIKHGWMLNDHHPVPPENVTLNIPAGLLKGQFNRNFTVPVC